MELRQILPIWNQLNMEEQKLLNDNYIEKLFFEGMIISKDDNCSGLIIVKSGQIRAYMLSEEGKEITLYRLIEGDICLFSASCVIKNIQFEVMLQAEKDSRVYIIDPKIYRMLMDSSIVISKFTNDIMASRFSEVMWLMEQIMWKSLDKRLAEFLLNEINLNNNQILNITHEKIANHLGTAREVITRMLKYFQNEKIIVLNRGSIEIIDKNKLEKVLI